MSSVLDIIASVPPKQLWWSPDWLPYSRRRRAVISLSDAMFGFSLLNIGCLLICKHTLVLNGDIYFERLMSSGDYVIDCLPGSTELNFQQISSHAA